MGGNRVCPDDCPLAIWASLSLTDRKAQRKPIAERLYRQGFTMQQIATQLGVTQSTISKDLAELVIVSNGNNSPRVRTASNPRGAGRHPGTRAPQRHYREDQIVALDNQGQTQAQIAAATGVGRRQVRHVVEREHIRREAAAETTIDPTTLSLSAQQRFETAIRQHKRHLDLQFEQRVQSDIRRRIEEIVLPHYNQTHKEHLAVIKARRGVLSASEYKKILACLHTDRSVSDRWLNDAFHLFESKKRVLIAEREEPTPDSGLPRTMAEWDEARRRATEERRARRTGAESVSRR
jgi:transcriptional regulator with XRE-family HTH domain